MAIAPFRIVSFQKNDVLTVSKMNQIANNEEWLQFHMPTVRYTAHGVRRTDQMKIASGFALIRSTKNRQRSKAVYFGNFFTTRCQPVVTTGIISNHRRYLHATVMGHGRLFPDHRGFRVYLNNNAQSKRYRSLNRNHYVAWTAVGY